MDDIAEYDFWTTMWGVENDIDGGVPFAPLHWCQKNDICVQCTSAPAISLLKNNGKLKDCPVVLNLIDDEDNPVIIIYHI